MEVEVKGKKEKLHGMQQQDCTFDCDWDCLSVMFVRPSDYLPVSLAPQHANVFRSDPYTDTHRAKHMAYRQARTHTHTHTIAGYNGTEILYYSFFCFSSLKAKFLFFVFHFIPWLFVFLVTLFYFLLGFASFFNLSVRLSVCPFLLLSCTRFWRFFLLHDEGYRDRGGVTGTEGWWLHGKLQKM